MGGNFWILFKWGKGGLFLVPILEFWCVILYVKEILVGRFGNLNAFYNFIPIRKYLEFLKSKWIFLTAEFIVLSLYLVLM